MNGIGSKAIAGTGALGIGTAIVTVGLYFLNLHPPQEIVEALQVIVNAPLVYAATYWAPHNTPPPVA